MPRSSRWFAPKDLFGFLYRTALRSEGLSGIAVSGRAVIGVANSRSELVNDDLHFDPPAAAVERGVQAAGGLDQRLVRRAI